MEPNSEITETPLVPSSPVPPKCPKPLSVPQKNPNQNPTGDLQSKGSTSPSLYTPNKPVPNYMKTTSHSCHDSCKYGKDHSFETKWKPPIRRNRRENEGIRGVVLNPELRTASGKTKTLNPKNRGEKKEIVKQGSSNEQSEDISGGSSQVEDIIIKDIHEMEMIIPPEKVFNLSDISSPIEDREIECSDFEKSKSNEGSDSTYEGLSVKVVGPTSFGTRKEPVETVPVTEPVPVPNGQDREVEKSKSNEGFESVYEGLSVNVVGSTSFEESGETVPVTEPVPVPYGEDREVEKSKSNEGFDSVYEGLSVNVVRSTSFDTHEESVPVPITELVPIELVPTDQEPKNMVKKKKNSGKLIVKKTGTGISQPKGVGTKGEITVLTKKKTEREKSIDKPSLSRKKDTVRKDGTGTKVKDIQSIDDVKEKKIDNGVMNRPKIVETKVIKRAAFVKPPAVRPVPVPTVVKLRKFKKEFNGTNTSSMENNPSEKSNNSDRSAKEKTIYVVEPNKTKLKNRYQKGNPSPSDVPVPKSETKRRAKNGNSVPKPPLPVSPHKLAFRKGKIVNLQSENPVLVHKLAFRRGKIVNVQSENAVPVRLKFRKVKPSNLQTSNNINNNNKGVRKKREIGTGTTPPSGTGTPAVILRRQTGTINKKSEASNGLFNHVIEETASKLVEKRKSKVKALVGAFETVISLHEKSVVN